MVFKWIWGYIRKYKLRMIIAFILVISCSMLNMVAPYLSGQIVDKVIIGKNHELLIQIIVIMVIVTFVKSIIRYIFLVIFESTSQNVILKVREDIYQKIQGLDFGFFDRTRTGDIMTRMTGDVDAVRHFMAFVIYSCFENLTLFIFAMVMMFSINYKFALILLLVTPFTAYFAFNLATRVKPMFFGIRAQFSKLNTLVQENISGNRVVKAFAKEDYEIQKFNVENEKYMQKNIEAAKVWEKYLPILDSLGGVLSVVMILVGGLMAINHALTLGELVTFNSFIFAINNPLRMSGWLINDIQRFAASGEKIMAMLDIDSKIENPISETKMDKIFGSIEFKNVSFSYGDEPVLENISFKVKAGQTAAIVGPTGAGKSTLVNLICRFYDVTSGEILIDGVNIKNINVKKLRNNISIAMQDIFLFSDTIEGNIAYGIPDASTQMVENMAGAASADRFIGNFPESYDTIIGERGVGLSGGQKQRIALARALLKHHTILILDDTTSSVDVETEHKIQQTLKSNMRGKTTFVIAHRISTVMSADVILVLDNGRILEQGMHEELLKKRGYYYSVYQNQFGNFDNDEGLLQENADAGHDTKNKAVI